MKNPCLLWILPQSLPAQILVIECLSVTCVLAGSFCSPGYYITGLTSGAQSRVYLIRYWIPITKMQKAGYRPLKEFFLSAAIVK